MIAWVAAAVWLAWLSLVFCEYRFGANDQIQYLVQLVAFEDERAFEGDPYLVAFDSLGSVIWRPIAWLTDDSWRAGALLALTMGVAVVNALLLMAIADRLVPATMRRGRFVAVIAPALALVTPKEQNWFGLVGLADVEFTATYAVTPVVLLSMLLWTMGRPLAAGAMGLVAAPIQGQTAAALLCAWWFATLLTRSDRRPMLLAASAIGGGAALLYLRSTSRLPPEMIDAYVQIGRDLYAPLINPLEAPWKAWAGVLSLLMLGLVGGSALLSAEDESAAPHRAARRLATWGAAALVFPVVALLPHAAGMREPLLWKLMTGRAFMLPMLVSITLISIACARAMRSGRGGVFAASVGLLFLAIWPVESALGAVTVLVIALAGLRSAVTPVATREIRTRGVAWVAVVASVPVSVTGVGRFMDDARAAWLRRHANAHWLDVQRWALMNTSVETRFVTPPTWSGWRVGARRGTYGELYDGGLLFYGGEPVLDWAGRMRTLGHERPSWASLARDNLGLPDASYQRAMAGATRDSFGDWRPAYLIADKAADPGCGQVVYDNFRFVVRRLPERGGVDQSGSPSRRGQ